MEKNIVIHEEGRLILGSITFTTPTYTEVRLLLPYRNFVLCRTYESGEDADPNLSARQLLQEAEAICRTLHSNPVSAVQDFAELMRNLESFNNQEPELYRRNRDELMKVFLTTHLGGLDFINGKSGVHAKAVFRFLALHLALHGKNAALEYETKRLFTAVTPRYTELEEHFHAYRSLTESEKTALLVERCLGGGASRFDWLLQLEFLNP